MDIDAALLTPRFHVTPEVKQQLRDLLSRGLIRITDDHGTTSYRIDTDFGLGVRGFSPSLDATERFVDVDATELLAEVISKIGSLTREQVWETEFYGRMTPQAEAPYRIFTALWDQIEALYQWMAIGHAVQEGVFANG